jgi:acyl carrier protein
MLQEVVSILKESLQLSDRSGPLTSATRLLGSIPELDSMAVVTILTMIEDRFGVIVEDDEVSADVFQSVGSLLQFVESKVKR